MFAKKRNLAQKRIHNTKHNDVSFINNGIQFQKLVHATTGFQWDSVDRSTPINFGVAQLWNLNYNPLGPGHSSPFEVEPL